LVESYKVCKVIVFASLANLSRECWDARRSNLKQI